MASKLIQFSKLNKILFATPKHQPIFISANSFSSSGNQKSQDDDAMTQGVDPDGETGHPKQGEDKDNIIPTKLDDHYMHSKTPPSNFSASKLQTPGISTPIDPHVQQKRRSTRSVSIPSELTCAGLDVGPVQQNHVMSARRELKSELTCAGLDGSHVQQRRVRSTRSELKSELTCAGLDGSPWPEETASRKEQEEDDKEYFEDRKASPLSNMEMGETRKPLEKWCKRRRTVILVVRR